MARKKSAPETLASYEKPPLVEVVCGLRFEPLQKLRIPHLGVYWSGIEQEFPTCEHAPPLDLIPDLFDAGAGLPMPRVWLINKAEDRLIQLQKNAFIYNWRKREGAGAYPRFRKLFREFKEHLSTFQSFLNERQIGIVTPTDCELTYINHITKDQGWESAGDFGRFFRDVTWRAEGTRFLSVPQNMGWTASFALPEDKGVLHAKIDQGSRKVDNVPVLVLELRARGLGADRTPKAVNGWFAAAHERIVCAFEDLTDPETQKTVWKKL
jgi:uncharacterized protein (TIGR04255 family)